jgi:multiple sugar transport system ATP-binding protein
MAEVYLDKIKHIYKGEKKPAVEDVTIKIPNSSFVALLGPSGCGKTTLMKIIAGLIKPTEGKVYFDGEDVSAVPAEERNVGMVFQFIVTYDMSVYDNIAFPLKVKRVPKEEIRKKVVEVAEMLDLKEYLERHPMELDAAMRQRVAIARALVKDAKIYLLDEPLTNLDPAARARLRSDIKKNQKYLKQTILYVTHDQTEALTLAEKIAIMNSGKIIQYDEPSVLYEHPKNMFVAHFLGNPGMNFIDCELKDNYLISGSWKYSLDESWSRELSKYGQEFVLGIRPEYVEVSKERLPGYSRAEVSLTEGMGNLNLLHLRIGDVELRAKVALFNIKKGDEVFIHLPKNKIRMFDKKTEELILG